MDRSGTSLVANLVALWGAYGGDADLLKRANDFNPNGFYEEPGLQQLLARLLNSLDTGYWDPSFPARLERCAAEPDWQRRANALLDDMAASGKPWFWKEPILSVTLPFWKPFLEDCVFVIPVRDPYDSAVSYEKLLLSEYLRPLIQLRSTNLLRWQHFLRSCVEATEVTPHKIFVPYEELTADPETHCRRLCDFLDARYGTDGLPPDRVARMAAAVDPKLRRNRGGIPFDEREDVTPEQKALYRFLRARVDDPGLPYEPERYAMYAGWREHVGSLSTLLAIHTELEPALRSPLVAGAYYLNQGLRWLTARPRRWWAGQRRRRQSPETATAAP
jgi:hypothetical protein